jgi:two-component system nitrate/nitrite response regulator NarL
MSIHEQEGDPLNDARVLIVDDHKLFAEAVSVFLEKSGFTVVGLAHDGAEALAAVGRERPDLVLLDLNLPDCDGLSLGARILERRPTTKLLAVTAMTERSAVAAAVEAGFHGYLTKDANVSQFVTSIQAALSGQLSVPHGLVTRRRSEEEATADLLARQLTTREREILRLLAEGAASEEIARRLSISANTVRTHVHNVLTKLGVHSRLEAAAFAVRHGLVAQGRSWRSRA